MNFLKTLLSENGAASSMRFVKILLTVIFSADWIYTRFIINQPFTPTWETVSLIASILGFSLAQKYVERAYGDEYNPHP